MPGCDQTDYDRLLSQLYLGRPVPSSHLTVELHSIRSRPELYELFRQMATENGYISYFGTDVDEGVLGKSGIPVVFGWKVSNDQYAWQIPSVEFSWDYESTDPTTVYVKIEASAQLEYLGRQEWLEFEKWRTQILPKAFPEDKIVVSQHPAELTNFADLEQISEATGISIPGEVWENYEAWLLSGSSDE